METLSFERVSPVALPGTPLRLEVRSGWPVAGAYADEGEGPHLVDLSHRPRWDLQSPALDKLKPMGLDVPGRPGEVRLGKTLLINRLNATQAALWHLAGEFPALPQDSALTDVTEAALCLALLGRDIFRIAEKLTALDLEAPAKPPPFLTQGPLSHVPCQIVVLRRNPELGALVFTCSRGYGRDMVHAVLQAGAHSGLRPAGEDRFLEAWKTLGAAT